MQRSSHGRTLVSRREPVAHQLPGDISSLPRSEMLCHRDKKIVTVLLRLDNTSAVSYVSYVNIVRDLWLWCMNRDITLTAEHLPGVLNTIADEKSRVMKDRSNWRLDPEIFHQIQVRWGPLEVDMFASRLTTQLERFFSWRPDSEVEARDAFSQDWTRLQRKGYANPPWNLVGRVLNRVQQQEITQVLIAPVWKSQPWYPTLLELLVDFPLCLPQRRDLIMPTHPQCMPVMTPQLAAWHISGDATKTKQLQSRARSCFSPLGDKSHHGPMTHSLGSGWTGVVGGIPILFQHLVNFLAHLFKEGYQYHSLNSYRLAISSVHERVDGYEAGGHRTNKSVPGSA